VSEIFSLASQIWQWARLVGVLSLVTHFRLCWRAGALRHSLQDRLSKATGSGRSRTDEIYLKLRTSTGSLLDCTHSPPSSFGNV
jgi:hypothetical protein